MKFHPISAPRAKKVNQVGEATGEAKVKVPGMHTQMGPLWLNQGLQVFSQRTADENLIHSV
jgi:hypothetical protein